MLDGIPFGCPGRIVTDRHRKPEAITELLGDLIFPSPASMVAASATITEDQKGGGVGVAGLPFPAPPLGDRVCGELGSLMTLADK